MTLLNAVIILLLVLGVLLAVVLLTRRRKVELQTAAAIHTAPARARAPEPADAEGLATAALRCLEQGDLDRAHKGFQALLLLGLDDGPMSKAEAYVHLGEVYERRGERKKAINMAEKAQELDPEFAPAQELLTRLSAGA